MLNLVTVAQMVPGILLNNPTSDISMSLKVNQLQNIGHDNRSLETP